MSALLVSTFANATDTTPKDLDVAVVLRAIRTGRMGEKNLREQIEHIRNRFQAEFATTGDYEKAKKAVSPLKKQLLGVIWSGRFTSREHPASAKLIAHSGLFPADLDSLNEKREDVRSKLIQSPYVWSAFRSPTDGLKAIFRVVTDVLKHDGSFLAVQQHVRKLCGVEIDESGKDLARLCFLSHDPDVYHNPDAQEIAPSPVPEKPQRGSNGVVNLSERQRIAVELVGEIRWNSEAHGFATCPRKHLHTTGDSERDCEIHLDGSPTLHCFHNHCRGILDGINHELRSRVGKAEYVRPEPPADENQATRNDDKKEQTLPKSAATRLVEFAEAFIFFHDPEDRPFVRLEIKGHTEIWPVESTKFRKLLARTYYQKTKKAINRNALADAVTTLAGKAFHDGGEEPVFLRVAWHGENIVIDLCDDKWRVVEVTPSGWRVLDKSPVAFIRTGSMEALPLPVEGGSIEPLWGLLNVKPEQRPLVVGSYLNAFDPEGPYFVTNYIGEQGTAKSCAAKIERQSVDPNVNPLRSPPKEERDLIAQAAGNRVVALDNLSYLPPWLSDSICRLATGGGHSARTLYTDLEEISWGGKRPVIFNGIEDVAVRPDLAERALQIELKEIDHGDRIKEKDLWLKFGRVKATIFSGILNGLVCALQNYKNIKLASLPRMADAAIWVTAGETALGFKRGAFMAAYQQNLDESALASIESSAVGLAIRKLFEQREIDQWQGETTDLLNALNGLLTEKERAPKNWPQNPRALGHALRRLAPALRRGGFGFERVKSNDRILILTKMCKVGKTTSRTSTTSFY